MLMEVLYQPSRRVRDTLVGGLSLFVKLVIEIEVDILEEEKRDL